MVQSPFPAYPARDAGARRSRISTVTRILVITGVVVLALVGLSLVAAYVLVGVAMANFGSNK